jgi:NNP family nitrate/nitrite transporter-like MFS transporter
MVSDTTASEPGKAQRGRALTLSTIAFTACFAVWTIFSIIGVEIQRELGLTETQFGLLIGTPILTGSIIRLVTGIWAEQLGGRLVTGLVMLTAAVATILLTFAHDYPTYLLAALGVGVAGGAFASGVVYVSHWYPKSRQGTALGIFGMGNVGAAVTKFFAPTVMMTYGWHNVAYAWGAVIGILGIAFLLFAKEDPLSVARRASAGKIRIFSQAACAPEGNSGLAVRALLLFCVRRLCCAFAMAAALFDRRIRLRHQVRRYDCGGFFHSRVYFPGLWRRAVG